MNESNQERSLTELTSYSLGTQVRIAVDEATVVLATSTGRIEIVESGGKSSTLSIEGTIESVAVDKYVFTLISETITAHTTSGIELWSTTVDKATAIAAIGESGVLGCVTADGRLVGLDIETGTDLYTVERPHDDIADIGAVVGGHGKLAVVAWSFLTVFDDNGQVLFDRNLEGAIEDIAVLQDAIVTHLKDGRVIYLSSPDGERMWSKSNGVRDIGGLGENIVLVADRDGVRRIDEHGNEDSLPLPVVDSVAATIDGSLLVLTEGGTQTIYQRGRLPEAALEGDILVDEVRVGEPLRLRVTNQGTRAVETSATFSVMPEDSLQLSEKTAAVGLDAGEETEVAVRVEEIASEDPVTITLTAEGKTIAEDTVSPVQDISFVEALDATTSVKRVTGSEIEISITVTNDAEKSASVVFEDQEVTVGPGESTSLNVRVPQDRTHDISLSATVGTETTDLVAPLPTLSADPAITVTAMAQASRPFLDVTVTNPFEATMADTLSITEKSGQLRVDRTTELEPEERLRIAIPLTESFIKDGLEVTASLDGFDVTEQVSLEKTEWSREAADATATTSGPESPPVSNRVSPWSEEGNNSTCPLAVDRELPEVVQYGERFSETITLRNEGETAVDDIEVKLREKHHTVGRLEPQQKHVLERKHAVFESGDFEIEGGLISFSDNSLSLSPHTVTVEPAPISVRIFPIISDSDVSLQFECSNNTDDAYQIDALGIDPVESKSRVWHLDSPPILESGESTDFERRVRHLDEQFEEPLSGGIRYTSRDGDTTRYWTLTAPSQEENSEASVDSETEDETPQPSDHPFVVEIEPQSSPVVGQNTAIECTLKARESLNNVSIEAGGEVVTPLSAGQRDIGQVDPGESKTHIIDIKPENKGIVQFELIVTETGSKRDMEQTYLVSGPVVESADAVEKETSKAWSATQRGGDDLKQSTVTESEEEETVAAGEDGDWPTHLVTSFRVSRGNLH